MTKKQHYMTWEERQRLAALWNDAKLPVAEIARIMGFCRQTIYNELRLGQYLHTVRWWDETRYSPEKAQQLHELAQSGKGRPEKIGNDHAYAQFLERKIMKDKYSPAAALAAARCEGFTTTVCVTTLYSYIYKGLFLRFSAADLWNKPKPKKPHAKRVAHPKLPSIVDRPQQVNDRAEYGHWEMDLVVGKAETRPVLLTLTERSSREELIFKLPNKQAATVRGVFDKLEHNMPDFARRFKTITTDNGSEFLAYDALCRSIHGGKRFDVYYCHSYASWEKGSNENHNRMIRRFFPKGTDFSRISKKRVAEVQDWMNSYPRKILAWRTPLEAAISATAPKGPQTAPEE